MRSLNVRNPTILGENMKLSLQPIWPNFIEKDPHSTMIKNKLKSF